MKLWIAGSMLVALALFGCGGQNQFTPVGNVPITQAPPPINGNGAVPPGVTPFNPGAALPSGYPPAYTPFLPIDNYMRGPQTSGYWNQFWGGWQTYAYQNQIQPYNFNAFWYQYCPQQWQGTQMWSTYQYFNSNVYYWANQQTQFPTAMNPSYFWASYSNYNYAGLSGGCGECGY